MCARFSLTASPAEVARLLDVAPEQIEARLNIAPTDTVIGAIERDGERLIREFRWGLIPSWAKDIKVGQRMINARAETLHEKAAFKNAYERRRCVIPASSFYEWKHIPVEEPVTAARGGAPNLFGEFEIERPAKKPKVLKQPYAIGLKSGEVFGLAGLWEMWSDDAGNRIRSCTVITTEPNEMVAELHDRMPVMLRHDEIAQWLSSQAEDLDSLLHPIEASALAMQPVTLS